MVLLPPVTAESRKILDDVVEGANGLTDAWRRSCQNASRNSNGVTNLLLGLCEILVMQRSGDSIAGWEVSERARENLPVVLGSADHLFRLAVSVEDEEEEMDEDENEDEDERREMDDRKPFSVGADFLPCRQGMSPSELWRTSVLGHVVAILGGLDQAGGASAVPHALQPFAMLLRLNRPVLNKTFWPGLPDNEWHAWSHSALFRHRLGNPDGCNLLNGGADHNLAPGQNLVAVPRATHNVFKGWNNGCDTSPRPGLWSLIDGEMTALLRRGNARDTAESSAATSVRGLKPIAFRALHLLVHAGALASALMERSAGNNEPTLEVLHRHFQVQ
jgi:hypothetical protein